MILVDPRSAVPPFEQIRVQLLELIRRGDLGSGTRLPTVRKLAADLALAPNTVARAYRELELNGVVESRGRHGTFVSSHDEPIQQLAHKAAQDYLHQIQSLGLGIEDARGILENAMPRSAVEHTLTALATAPKLA